MKKQGNRRKSAEFKRRSKAAKKGWDTRRKKELKANETLVQNAAKALGQKPNPRIETKELTRSQLKKALEAEKLARTQAEQLIATVGFVDIKSPEWLHRGDLTMAVFPCRIRHIPEATKLQTAMKKARKKGELYLAQMANEIAMHYKVPVREVYTLFWSP